MPPVNQEICWASTTAASKPAAKQTTRRQWHKATNAEKRPTSRSMIQYVFQVVAVGFNRLRTSVTASPALCQNAASRTGTPQACR